MKILFIGGTGVISTEITKRCIALGWDVTLLNRGRQSGRLPEGVKARNWNADINDESAVRSLLEGETFDVVANFINFTPGQAERDVRLFSGKTKQYIFISSASAYQKPLSDYLIRESTPLANPYWEYSREKIACENILTDAYRKHGFPFTVVRPSHTYDIYSLPVGLHGEKGAWQVIKRMMDGKPVLVQGDGSSLWTVTHSRDFAKGFTGLMGNLHAIGEAVHITSDESLTWNQIYASIGGALNVEPKLYHVSSDFLCACEPSFTGPLHGDKSVSVVFDNSKLKRLVPGFAAEIRFDQGARWSVEYFLSHPEAQKEDPVFDAFTESVIAAQKEAVARVRPD
ncbi:MAG: SDR family oxidoreductase [Clostridiales bacterium]|jgi:nucleoside-diphosphate-sugar epimerase|nr:SDR family oxidoreductase [Clostridiales bacterium]